jgi:hypothetical protein
LYQQQLPNSILIADLTSSNQASPSTKPAVSSEGTRTINRGFIISSKLDKIFYLFLNSNNCKILS